MDTWDLAYGDHTPYMPVMHALRSLSYHDHTHQKLPRQPTPIQFEKFSTHLPDEPFHQLDHKIHMTAKALYGPGAEQLYWMRN